MGYIYKITNNINDKIYIGQTICDIKTRWQRHLSTAKTIKKRTLLYDAFFELGFSNFQISLVEECDNELLNEREKYWIAFYDSYNNGYNMTTGGGNIQTNAEEDQLIQKIYELWDKGLGITEISRELDVSRGLISNRLYIYKNYSAEDAIKRGQVNSAKAKFKKVYQWDKNGQLINEYNSLKEASEKNNFSYKALSHAFSKGGSSNGYYWTSINTPPSKLSEHNSKRVGQYDLEGNLIKIYFSRLEAGKETGLDPSTIGKCCNNESTYGGFLWKNE